MQNRGPSSLWDHGRDTKLPFDADIVIIGAGVTGVSLAYHLTRSDASRGKRIVLLDAKDVASCASGRNGGHVAPESFTAMKSLTTPLEQGGPGLSPEEALDVLFFQQDNLDLVDEIVYREKLDVDWWRGHRYDGLEMLKGALDEFHRVHRKSRHADRRLDSRVIFDTTTARRVTRVKDARAVLMSPSASWHPHRGVTALLRLALASRKAECRFYSWAPVAKVSKQGKAWEVDCGARGSIRAKQVVLATNGYSRHLIRPIDELVGKYLTPFLGHAGRVVPPPAFAGARALKHSYSAETGPYLIETPNSGLILGPNDPEALGLPGPRFDVEDDSKIVPVYKDWIERWCREAFTGWGKEMPGEGLVHTWTGIMCHTPDALPLAGPVPGQDGLFIAAGFNGHGMAYSINITRSLSKQLLTGKRDKYLPHAFDVTHERMERALQRAPPVV